MATSAGAMFSSHLLTDQGDKLIGIEHVAIIAILLSIPVPVLLRFIEKLIKKQHV